MTHGVATEAELAFLEERECDEAQGFFFSRPLPPYQFAELFKQGGAAAILN